MSSVYISQTCIYTPATTSPASAPLSHSNLCRAKWGKNLRVFGSVARGEEKDTSDIDLLVDLPADITLITLEQLRYELEQILGARVDLATLDSLRPKARVEAERDAIAV